MKKKLIECLYCPCQFLTQTDIDFHMEGFGSEPDKHLKKWLGTLKRRWSGTRAEYEVREREILGRYTRS